MIFVYLRVLVVLLFSVSLPFLVLLREDSSKISPLWLSLLLPLQLLPASCTLLSCQTSLPVLSQTVGHLGSTISNKSSPSTAGTLPNKDSASAFPSRARRSFISSPFPPLAGKGQSLPSRWPFRIGLPRPVGGSPLHHLQGRQTEQGRRAWSLLRNGAVRARLPYPTMAAADLDVLGRDQFIQGLDSRTINTLMFTNRP